MPVDRRERGALRTGPALGLDAFRKLSQVGGWTDDVPHRHLHSEDLVQQVGEGQRGQGVAAEVGEMRVRVEAGAGGSQQHPRGADQGVDHRLVCSRLAQGA